MASGFIWRAAIAIAALAGGAQAQSISSGTYVLDGGSYSIEVINQGDTLLVKEPNRDSPYKRHPDGSWRFYNPNTDANYAIRYVDPATIEAYKPDQPGNVPSRLNRLGGAPAAEATPAAPAAAPSPSGRTDFGSIADSYMRRALDEPDDVQVWSFCAAAAKKREVSTAAEADAYALKAAESLKLILTDTSRSPCEDVISPTLWSVGGGGDGASAAPPLPRPELSDADKARLADLNAKADARAEAGKAEAARFEAAQQAYRDRVAEVKGAEEKFARDQAAYEAEAARVKAAEDAYQRQMEEWRRATGNPGA